MNRLARLAACALLLGAGSMADRASAFCRMTTEGGAQIAGAPCEEKGAPLFWATPCLSYAIDVNASKYMDYAAVAQAVDASFATWQTADCGGGQTPNLVFQPPQASDCKRAEYNCEGNVNTIAFLDPWRDECEEGLCNGGVNDDLSCTRDEQCPDGRCVFRGYDQWAFAVTIVWHNTSTGEIFDADMMINDLQAGQLNAGGPYENCPDAGCGRCVGGVNDGDVCGTDDDCPSGRCDGPADLRSIVTHEAGHFIGIGHSEVGEATMFASAERTSVNKRDLATDDINAVCSIYPPGNLDSTCDATPRGGLQLDCTANECADAACGSNGNGRGRSGGCNAGGSATDAPWASMLAALLGLTVLRRRSRWRAAKS